MVDILLSYAKNKIESSCPYDKNTTIIILLYSVKQKSKRGGCRKVICKMK